MSIQQIAFVLIAGFALWFSGRQFLKIRRNIFLAKDEEIGGDSGERWKNVLLIAFGQKKMFKRWIPAVFHFFIYAAFVITQIELIEIFVDGIFGQHRFFANAMGGFYTFIISAIEVLTVLAFFGTIVFLARRNLLKIPRFIKDEMTGWPKLDANLILIGELMLIVGIICMNGADVVLQNMGADHYPQTGNFAVSSWLGPLLFGGLSESGAIAVERFGWWLHILTVLGFLCYLPYSKHLHILFAFPNVYFSKLNSRGEMPNMTEVMQEVKSMMGLIPEDEVEMSEEMPEFGANDIFGLSWKNVLDSYSCTECGRCTDVCPANLTGKKLSPRKILMDIRDRATEIGNNLDTGNVQYVAEDKRGEGVALTSGNYDDGKTLFDRISREEIHACTTCNACVEACPVLIDPLEPILKLRRYEILTEATGPADWTPMFTALENAGSVWQVPDARDAWTNQLKDA